MPTSCRSSKLHVSNNHNEIHRTSHTPLIILANRINFYNQLFAFVREDDYNLLIGSVRSDTSQLRIRECSGVKKGSWIRHICAQLRRSSAASCLTQASPAYLSERPSAITGIKRNVGNFVHYPSVYFRISLEGQTPSAKI